MCLLEVGVAMNKIHHFVALFFLFGVYCWSHLLMGVYMYAESNVKRVRIIKCMHSCDDGGGGCGGGHGGVDGTESGGGGEEGSGNGSVW